MKAKKGDLLNLWYIFEGMKHQKQSVKFSYFVAKNKVLLKGEVDALNEAQAASEAFKAYDQKRADLAAEMADRIPGTDQPMVNDGQYVIKERKEEFDKQLEEIKTQFKDVIEERTKQLESIRELLDEEVKFDGYKIQMDNIPDSIEPNIMEAFIVTDLIME